MYEIFEKKMQQRDSTTQSSRLAKGQKSLLRLYESEVRKSYLKEL